MKKNYSNFKISLLTLKPSKTICLFLMVLFVFLFSNVLSAQKTWNGITNSNWNTPNNWTPSGVPTIMDDVIIPDGKNLTVDVTNAACNKLTINTGGNDNNVSVGSNTLSVAGALTINFPDKNNKTKIISITSGVLNCGSIVLGNSSSSSRDCRVSVTAGTINVKGDITMGGNANENQLLLGSGGTLNIAGNFIGAGGDIVPGNNSTINFNGTAAQIIALNGNFTYNNLEINNAAGATLQTTVTNLNVTGNITVKTGTLNNGGFAVTGNTTKSFTVANGATFQAAATPSSFPTGFGTNVLGATSTVEYNGTGNQNISNIATPGYGNLTLSASGTKTADGVLAIQGNLNINSGTIFVASNFIHNIAGNWTNNGTFTAGTSTINFNSTITGKTISGTISGTAGQFYNLTFNGVGGGYIINSNLDVANTLTVTNGAVSMNGIMTVAGTTSSSFTVASPAILSFENNASLLQSGYTGTNNPSNINVKKNSTPIINDDFTYWSSPTSANQTSGAQTLLNFSPNTQPDKFSIFDNDWANVNAATTIFSPGIGYAIRSPEGISVTIPAVIPFQFTGVPNNGVIAVPVTAITDAFGPAGLRLIGNPYPSALDADAFIDANIVGLGTINKTVTGTLYFWTHNHSLTGNNYSATDYATYTKLGGTGTVGVLTGIGNKNVPTKFIASGQGFFVEVDAKGTVTFNNAMRSAVNNANTNFYKIASKKTESLQSHRVWLNLTNNSENFSQALVGYAAEATDQYDPGYDGTSFGGETYGLYSLLGTDELTIQARALPFVDTDIVPLGYTINVAGNAVITIDHVDGIFLNDQKVYLEDKLLNVIHDVKSSPYNFSSAAGTFNDRFVLRYTGKTLGTKDFDLNENTVLIAKDRNELKIKSQQENIRQITVFDLLGRKVFDKEAIDTNEFRTSNITVKKQIIVVKVTLSNGQVISKKVIF